MVPNFCILLFFTFSGVIYSQGIRRLQDANPTTGLPEIPFWSSDGKSVAWDPWMTDKVYERCSIPNQSEKSPIDPDSLLNLAHEFRAAQALQLVSNNDMRHFASMAPIEFEESLSDGMVAAGLDLALRPRFPYFVIGFGVIILLISLISLCTIAEGCRNCCAVIWCKLCCGYRKRPSLFEYGWLIKGIVILSSIIFILGVLILVPLGAVFAHDIVTEAEHSICRVYLFPLELTSGVGYNQTEYQKRSGRDVQVSRRWAGIVALRNALGELKDNLTQSDNPDTIIHRVKEFSSDVTSSMTAILDQESHDLGRLMTSLAETKANLAGIPSNGHMCLLCDSAETGAINDMVINAMAEIEQQKSTIQQFSQNIDSPVFNNTANLIDLVQNMSLSISDYIDMAYTHLEANRITAANAAKYTEWSAWAISAITFLCFIAFCVSGAFTIRKAREEITTHSRSLTGLLTCTWCSLLLWASFLFLLTGVLLLISGIAAEPCLISEDLFVDGDYASYPLLTAKLSSYAGKLPNDTEAMLTDFVSLTGTGELGKDQKEAVLSNFDVADTLLSEIDRNLEGLGEMANNLSALHWVFIIDFRTALASELVTYREVLFSGLQLTTQSLDPLVINLLEQTLQGTPLQNENVTSIYGFEDAENAINAHLPAGYTAFDRWCFGNTTTCSDTGNVKHIDEMFDITIDPDVVDIQTRMSAADGIQFVNSVIWMVRKLKILNALPHPFTTINNEGNTAGVPFNSYVSPDNLVASSDSPPFLNALTHNITSGFSQRLSAEATAISVEAKSLIDVLRNMIDDVFGHVNVSRSLMAELIAIIDPVCKGVIGSFSALSIVWTTLAFVQLIGGVIGYKVWHYFKDLDLQEKEEAKQRLLMEGGEEFGQMPSGYEDAEVYVTSSEMDE